MGSNRGLRLWDPLQMMAEGERLRVPSASKLAFPPNDQQAPEHERASELSSI